MAIAVGDRIGPFEVLGLLGSGGMGDVYRARDPRLHREVALKVLRAAIGDDAARGRFEREARAAGRLNHPNVVAVHDVGSHGELGFIVTELLEGETLRDVLDGAPLPPRKAVDLAIQIAAGLAAGHESGIVHLDVKPANLFVTRDGRVKILDFGIARASGPASPGDTTETIAVDGAPPRAVAGTAAYMAPEQARGRRADHRADIFSFGCVVYEMLAGVPPFRRATTGETLAAILNEDPSPLGSAVPPALETIVRRCLEKAPEQRFQSARDLVFTLEALPERLVAGPPSRRGPRRAWRGPAAAALLLLAVAAAGYAGYRAGRRPAPAADAGALQRVRRLTDFPGLAAFPAISPDGRVVAFTASVSGHRQVFVRLIAGGPALPITTEPFDHEHPRWSPDANTLVYFAHPEEGEEQGTIWAVPALGGSRQRVTSCLGGADVGRKGRLACFRLAEGSVELVTTRLDGSDLAVVGRMGGGYHRNPRFSPDDRFIAFQRGDGVRLDVFVIPAAGGTARQLTRGRDRMAGLAWLPDGSGLVYGSSAGSTIPYLPPFGLWEVRLDGGPPRPIAPPGVSYEQPDVHASGLVAAVRPRMQSDIWRFPFAGAPADNVRRAANLTRQTGLVLTPTASPDGNAIAFLSDSGGHANIWAMSTTGGNLRQITFEQDPAVSVGAPVWSPVGRTIAFVSSRSNTGLDFGVSTVEDDGRGQRQVVRQGVGMAWSADGRWLYYADSSAGVLNKVPVEGGAPVRVRSEPTRNVIGAHGGTLYYTVERPLVDGRPEIDIRAAAPEDGPARLLARLPAARVREWQIVNPALSPDGKWLALTLTDGPTTNIWALSTATGAWRQVTDFGDRAVFIARRVSWSADGASIFAAVGEGDADVVLLDGLIAGR